MGLAGAGAGCEVVVGLADRRETFPPKFELFSSMSASLTHAGAAVSGYNTSS